MSIRHPATVCTACKKHSRPYPITLSQTSRRGTVGGHLALSCAEDPQTAAPTIMVSLPSLSGSDGLKALNDHLLTRSYVTGYALHPTSFVSKMDEASASKSFSCLCGEKYFP